MEFIRTIREKHITKHQDDVLKEAEEKICLADFDSSLYIAYAGTPLLPIKEEWTSKEILQELSAIRQNYVNSKMRNYDPTFFQSLFQTSC